MALVRRLALASMVASATAAFGCTSLLGDFTVSDTAADASSSDGSSGDAPVTADGGGGDGMTMGDGPAADSGAGHLVIDKMMKDFGTHTLNSSVPAETFTVTNNGSAMTGMLTVTVNGTGFNRAGGTCMGTTGIALAQGQTCTVDVTIDTTRIAMPNGTLVVADGASDMVSASLSGKIVMSCPMNMPTICTGTCVDTVTDPLNCNSCGNRCPSVANGSAGCASSVCGIGMCNAGFRDCNNMVNDGCEIGITNDLANCGACARQCAIPNGQPACVNSACTVSSCNSGFNDCNMMAVDGCEVNVNTDIAHCGSCAGACNLPNAIPTCTNGTCRVLSCVGSFHDCDGTAMNGCEVDTTSNDANCGACGSPCMGGKHCTGSVCACIGGTPDLCAGVCTNKQTDAANCGACGHSCLGGACNAGACQPLVIHNLAAGSGQGIAVDAANVYFSDGNGGHLFKCPLSGCVGNPTVLLSGLMYADSVYYDAGTNSVFVADGKTSVFYNVSTTGTLIYQVTVPGSYAGYATPRAFYADATNLYFGNNGNSFTEIDKVVKATGAGFATNNSNISPSKGVWSLAYDAVTDRLFTAIFSANQVGYCPRTGGGCTLLSTNPLPTGVVVVGNKIFFSVRGTSPGYADGGIFTATTALANYQVVASSANYAILNGSLTADALNVYWIGQSGAIYRCAAAGCGGAPTVISPSGMFYDDYAMTNDASAIYWSGNSTIAKLAK